MDCRADKSKFCDLIEWHKLNIAVWSFFLRVYQSGNKAMPNGISTIKKNISLDNFLHQLLQFQPCSRSPFCWCQWAHENIVCIIFHNFVSLSFANTQSRHHWWGHLVSMPWRPNFFEIDSQNRYHYLKVKLFDLDAMKRNIPHKHATFINAYKPSISFSQNMKLQS